MNASVEAQKDEEVELTAEVLRIESDRRHKAAQLDRVAVGTGGGSLARLTLSVSMEDGRQEITGFQEYARSQTGILSDISPLGVSSMNTSHF